MLCISNNFRSLYWTLNSLLRPNCCLMSKHFPCISLSLNLYFLFYLTQLAIDLLAFYFPILTSFYLTLLFLIWASLHHDYLLPSGLLLSQFLPIIYFNLTIVNSKLFLYLNYLLNLKKHFILNFFWLLIDFKFKYIQNVLSSCLIWRNYDM